MGVSVMAIIDLKCKHCGGTTTMDDSRETGFCSYCGNKFIVKEELVRIAIEYSGTINVDRNREIDNLLARAERFYSERRTVENGGTLQLTVPIGSHTIKVGGWQTWSSNELTFSIVNRYSNVIVTYEPRAFSAKIHIHSGQTSIDND